jgi:hypothetical protein
VYERRRKEVEIEEVEIKTEENDEYSKFPLTNCLTNFTFVRQF